MLEYRMNSSNIIIIKHLLILIILLKLNQNSCFIFEMDLQRQLHQFQKKVDFIFALPLPSILRATLNHIELLLSFDFGTNTSLIENLKSRQKNNLDPQLMKGLMSLNKEERLDLYNQYVDDIYRLIEGEELYPCVQIVDIKTSGYVKRSKYSKWQLNKIQYSFNSHFVEISKENNFQNHYIDLSLYLYRRSKNKDYFAFVLQASDCRVSQYLRRLSIGFNTFQQFEMFSKSIRLSINIRQFDKIKSMFKGDPLTKNCLNSVKNKSLSRVFSDFNGDLDKSAKEQQFFSFEELPNQLSNPSSLPQRQTFNKQDKNKQVFAQEILRKHSELTDDNLAQQHQIKLRLPNSVVRRTRVNQNSTQSYKEIKDLGKQIRNINNIKSRESVGQDKQNINWGNCGRRGQKQNRK